MNKQYELILKLSIKGPFITSSGADAARGLNLIFSRDIHGRLVINGSHVKGKFREAIRDLKQLKLLSNVDDIENVYLGKVNADGVYLPERGKLHFHDFFLDEACLSDQKNKLTRVKIETKTGTAKENSLLNIEDWFKTGSISKWTGKITFFANNEKEAEAIRQDIIMGFKWITNFGAIKGNGYGRLEKVTAKLNPLKLRKSVQSKTVRNEELALRFEFKNDLFIGGIARGTTFKESQKVIPGAVIKGSLARFLNELCGAEKLTDHINPENEKVHKKFPMLTRYFSQIQFSHAFPSHGKAKERPVVIPFSTVKDTDGKPWDIALTENAILAPNGKALEFQIDWKDFSKLNKLFGWAECQTINKTRTAIEKHTRTAHEEMLYTFQYISPYQMPSSSKNSKRSDRIQKIRWLAKMRLPDINKIGKEFDHLCDELYTAFNSGWRYLGKRDARFNLDVYPGEVENQMPKHTKGNLVDNLAIIALQTDAFLFDGYRLAPENNIDLHEVYKRYWDGVTENSCEMIKYFARQKMSGGYLIKRFNPYPSYYPYILTEAGSVFILRAKIDKAQNVLQSLEMKGLPLPKDITSDKNKEPWQVCPFVPENGFGEICINLAWHWNKKLSA